MPEVIQQRVAKLMAGRGLCSRREAERLILAGEVTVDGTLVLEPGHKAPLDAVIRVSANAEAGLASKLTVVLHKPVGIVSTQPEAGQVPAWKLLRTDSVAGEIDPSTLARVLAKPSALSVAGRLDRASRGLLVLTEDGTVARRIIGGHSIKKSYRVRMSDPVNDAQLRKLGGAMSLQGRTLLPMEVRRIGPDLLRFVLVEGRKHQIRLVCRKVGLSVVDLCREAVGPLRLGDLPAGKWRLATRDEIASLLRPQGADTTLQALKGAPRR